MISLHKSFKDLYNIRVEDVDAKQGLTFLYTMVKFVGIFQNTAVLEKIILIR